MPTIIFILVLFIGIPLSGQELQFQNDGAEWFWYDADSVRHTRAELDTIIAHHQIWLKKVYEFAMENKKEGQDSTEAMQRFWSIFPMYPDSVLVKYRALFEYPLIANLDSTKLTGANLMGANLTHADLKNANLTHAWLTKADLKGANLMGANLTHAWLLCADLTDAYLRGADLTGADLTGANLTDAQLDSANLSRAFLWNTDLTRANLRKTNLTRANLRKTNLTHAILWRANLTQANLDKANLTQANLDKANLTGAFLWNADLKYTVFEPASLPSPHYIAYAKNLKWMTYLTNPNPLVKLKNSLFDAGYIKASKKVNTALKRRQANILETVLFDYTCEYGCNPMRPLGVLVIFIAVFGISYCFSPIFLKESQKYVIATYKGQKKERGSYYWKKLSLGKKIQIAFLFSLQRALRIGFRELSPNHWLQMLLPPEFEIKSRGWPRFVSGVQSIISVGLIVLTLLSYFSRPFESM